MPQVINPFEFPPGATSLFGQGEKEKRQLGIMVAKPVPPTRN